MLEFKNVLAKSNWETLLDNLVKQEVNNDQLYLTLIERISELEDSQWVDLPTEIQEWFNASADNIANDQPVDAPAWLEEIFEDRKSALSVPQPEKAEELLVEKKRGRKKKSETPKEGVPEPVTENILEANESSNTELEDSLTRIVVEKPKTMSELIREYIGKNYDAKLEEVLEHLKERGVNVKLHKPAIQVITFNSQAMIGYLLNTKVVSRSDGSIVMTVNKIS